ncbi:hypothetical protein FKM82_010394 [Ascaphus truei]
MNKKEHALVTIYERFNYINTFVSDTDFLKQLFPSGVNTCSIFYFRCISLNVGISCFFFSFGKKITIWCLLLKLICSDKKKRVLVHFVKSGGHGTSFTCTKYMTLKENTAWVHG